ncbi:hypothetical protein AAFX91_14015 [Bradyrhizobium sp. 31Argb]|uniref:hypothetical protein n=1 Tax=unclassified Bradyrhizobium TaxID=2631580 RepID=UPI00102ECC38|nr:hypothetical protein [Bradyrhizobium sp. Leo170]TAI63892.1 hypothetical protein CWO89_21910 [Bradyrhizobium sp. Leo170]
MRNTMCLRIAAVFVFSLTAAMPAFATKTGTALGICISRGTDCTVANKGDNYEICVKNTNGTQCVSCGNLAQPSDKQTCSVQRSAKPGGRPYDVGPAGLLADE